MLIKFLENYHNEQLWRLNQAFYQVDSGKKMVYNQLLNLGGISYKNQQLQSYELKIRKINIILGQVYKLNFEQIFLLLQNYIQNYKSVKNIIVFRGVFSMQKNFKGQLTTSLRSHNNCFKVSNIFRNKRSQKLSQNIEFIPKHVLRKIQQKQILACKDIFQMQTQIMPVKSSTDIFTVKMARKMQQKYQQNFFGSNNGQMQPPAHQKPVSQDWQDQIKKQITTDKSLQ